MQIFNRTKSTKSSTQSTKSTKSINSSRRLTALLIIALCIALSMVFKRFGITAGPFRISFENLPIILSGMILGPLAGFAVGAVGDILGCIISGFAINPIITLGSAVIGLIPGLMTRFCLSDKPGLRTVLSVALAHLVGSVIIKSIGLYVYYHHPFSALLLRIPLYIITGGAESYICLFLMKNKAFQSQIARVNVR